jgi:hypothetical protein
MIYLCFEGIEITLPTKVRRWTSVPLLTFVWVA